MTLRRRMTRSGALVLLLGGVAAVCGNASLSAQTLTFTPVGSIAGPIDLVGAEGTFAYIARRETLTVFDISNPAAPHAARSYAFPEKIWGFNVSDS